MKNIGFIVFYSRKIEEVVKEGEENDDLHEKLQKKPKKN